MFTTEEFDAGMRVELRPGSYLWEQGERKGRIVKVTNRFLFVHMDNSGQTYRMAPHVLLPVLSKSERYVRVIKRENPKWRRVVEALKGRR